MSLTATTTSCVDAQKDETPPGLRATVPLLPAPSLAPLSRRRCPPSALLDVAAAWAVIVKFCPAPDDICACLIIGAEVSASHSIVRSYILVLFGVIFIPVAALPPSRKWMSPEGPVSSPTPLSKLRAPPMPLLPTAADWASIVKGCPLPDVAIVCVIVGV